MKTPTPAVVRPIERSSPCQTQFTLDVLNFVAQNQPYKFALLFAMLGPQRTSGHDAKLLRHRLSYLVGIERLRVVGKRAERQFSLGAYAYCPKRRGSSTGAAQPSADPATTAQPDRHDRMRGALYVAPLAHCYRAGSQDHLRIASVGDAC